MIASRAPLNQRQNNNENEGEREKEGREETQRLDEMSYLRARCHERE